MWHGMQAVGTRDLTKSIASEMESEIDLSPYFVAVKDACIKLIQKVMFGITIKLPLHDTKLMMLDAVSYTGSRQVSRIHEVEFVELLTTAIAADRLHRLVSIEPESVRKVAVGQLAETREFIAILPSLISSLGAYCSKYILYTA